MTQTEPIPALSITKVYHAHPAGLFSWRYSLDGDDHHAQLSSETWSGHGRIQLDAGRYEIRKRGTFNRRWTMRQTGTVIASAHRPSIWSRRLEISSRGKRLTLQPSTALGCKFELREGGRVIARIEPEKLFSRRIKLTVYPCDIPLDTCIFALWLIILVWRQSADSA